MVALLAALAALGPFSVDAYLPSFHAIGTSLHASPLEVQQTLTAYMLLFAVMSLWHGAISDAMGRRKVVLSALALFALASLGCAFATRIEQLWLWRALQGVTAGAGIVVGRAVVRDLFDGAAAQRLMSHITMVFAIAPVIAPLIGGRLQYAFGWRAVFAFMMLMAALLCLACWAMLPETLPRERRQSLHPGYLVRAYGQVLTSPVFLLACAAASCNFAGFFLYVMSAPEFLMRHLGVAETGFLWLFAPAMCGLVGGAWLSGKLAGKMTPMRTVAYGYGIMACAATLNVVINLLLPPALPWSVLPIPLYTLGMSLTLPSLTLQALDPFPEQRGLASSSQMFLQSVFNALLAGVLAPAVWGSPLSLSLAMAALLVCGMLAAWGCYALLCAASGGAIDKSGG